MPTTTTKTIGSTGDYSTLQAWEDACPANLVTADEIWRGPEGGGVLEAIVRRGLLPRVRICGGRGRSSEESENSMVAF